MKKWWLLIALVLVLSLLIAPSAQAQTTVITDEAAVIQGEDFDTLIVKADAVRIEDCTINRLIAYRPGSLGLSIEKCDVGWLDVRGEEETDGTCTGEDGEEDTKSEEA